MVSALPGRRRSASRTAVEVRFEYGPGLYGPPFDAYERTLDLARTDPQTARHAVARTPEGAFAGRAWMFPDGPAAGIFDMEVWERFQRRGYGRALLDAVCDAAADAGARHAVLNATPQGKLLDASAGFTQIAVGATWYCRIRRVGAVPRPAAGTVPTGGSAGAPR